MYKNKLESAFNIVVKYGFCGDCPRKFDSEMCRKLDCYQNGVKPLMDVIKVASADVRPERHGRWIAGYSHDRVCSCCLLSDNDLDDYVHDYCPHCGAKMNRKD